MSGRKIFEDAMYRTGAYRLVGRRYAGCGVIFMMHSVVENAEGYLAEPIRCTVEVLDRLIHQLRSNEVEIVTLDAALARLGEPDAPRFAVLTFDDGYRDNLTHALPILKRHGAPATVYVSTCMVERTTDAWWLGLVEWLKRRERITVEGFGTRRTATVAAKIAARVRLTAWVQGDAERLDALREAMRTDGLDVHSIVDQQILTRDELRCLADHPLITIGGHTVSHPWLAPLSAKEARREISDNRHYLQDLIQQEVDHFAYPFGTPHACGEREARLVAASGFRSAVTSRHGCIFRGHINHRYALPREGVHWCDDEASIACKSLGAKRLFRDLKLKRPWRSPFATITVD